MLFDGLKVPASEVTVIDILLSSDVKVMEFKALPDEINDKKFSSTLKTVRTFA